MSEQDGAARVGRRLAATGNSKNPPPVLPDGSSASDKNIFLSEKQ
jgi:hypothetical protein